MKSMFLRMAMCLALFSACDDNDAKKGDDTTDDGGGDDGGDTTKTGKLQGGTITGMHYATASQSGVTGSDGTFKYSDGETVTFSLGGIKFGSATAKADVTLFDLFAVTPSSDVTQTITFLDPLATVGNLDRLVNATIVVMGLDIDANPQNGIDLTGLDTSLSGTAVSFDLAILTFISQELQRLAVRIPNFPVTFVQTTFFTVDSAFAYLFDSAGIDASGNGLVRLGVGGPEGETTHTELTLDARSFATKVQTFTPGLQGTYDLTRDAAGRVTAQVLTPPGEGAAAQSFSYTYNTHGQLLTVKAASGADAATTLAEYTYAADGRLATATVGGTVVTYAFDATANTVTLSTGGQAAVWTYDADGHVVSVLDPSTGSDTPAISTYVHGKLTQTSSASGGSTQVVAYTYTTSGLVASRTTTALSARVATNFTYDAQGRLTLAVMTSEDLDENGAVVGTPIETGRIEQTYNTYGLQSRTETRTNGETSTTNKTTIDYDASGNVVKTTYAQNDEVSTVQTFGLAPTHNRLVAFLQQLTTLFGIGVL